LSIILDYNARTDKEKGKREGRRLTKESKKSYPGSTLIERESTKLK